MGEMNVVETFINNLKQGNIHRDAFEAGLFNVKGRLSDGLPANIFESFVDVIFTSKVKAGQATKLVGCLIPEQGIGNNIIDRVLQWILSNHRKKSVTLLNTLLRWLVGVVEYGLADKSYVDKYYELIWAVVKNEKLERAACHLIHLLTRPEDIFRGRVQVVLKLHEHNRNAKHTMALLSLFKSYKPEYVPESVQIRNLQRTFQMLPQSLEQYLKLAQERLHDESTARKSNFECVWSRPFENQKIIPDAAYVHLGSDQYYEKRKKVIQCLDKKSLLHHQQTIEVPSNVLTLLLNEGGIHLLATHNRDIHVRFSYVVYNTLDNVFVQQRVTVKQRECEHFLKQLVHLEDYMQQGIPVVSRFLFEYICTWDGLEYREFIYRLLERITFKSFDELKVFVLDCLNTFFITGSIEEQCLIIRTLKVLVLNMFNQKRQAENQENRLTFLDVNPLDSIEVDAFVPQLTDYVGKMCRKGLQITNGHPLLLYVCIDFYGVVATVENYETSWSIIPRACVYRCLLGPSTSMMSQTGELLLKYHQTYKHVRSTGQLDVFEAEVAVLEEYAHDIYNCLVSDQALSKAHEGYIFKNLPSNLLHNGDGTFSVTNTVIMGSLIEYLKATSDPDSVEESVTVVFRSLFLGLCQYLDLVLKKNEH